MNVPQVQENEQFTLLRKSVMEVLQFIKEFQTGVTSSSQAIQDFMRRCEQERDVFTDAKWVRDEAMRCRKNWSIFMAAPPAPIPSVMIN